MKYFQMILLAVLAVVFSLSTRKAAATPLCNYPYLDSQQNQKLCLALATFFGLPNSLDDLPDDSRPNYGYKIPMGYKGGRIQSAELGESLPGTKRQDVDHVFLRFGRKR